MRRYVLGGYAAWWALLIPAYYGLSGLRTVTGGLIAISGVAGILAGVAVNRPARRVPWLLLAAAQLSFAAGQVSFLVAARSGAALPFPSFADLLYLLTYPLYATGLVLFIRWRTPDGDRRSLIDALTLTAGLALLSWTFLIRPYVHSPGLTGVQRAVAIAYPLGDVLVLALLARLLAPGAARSRCVQLLTLGIIGDLSSDVAFGLLQIYGSFRAGTIVDLGWAVFYSAWGAAALHPSMTGLTEPAVRQPREVSPARLALLMAASLIAPAVLIAGPPGTRAADNDVIAVFSAVLFLLVLSRLWETAASHHRALGRERVLRRAGLALVSAAEADQTAAVVRTAVTALLGDRMQGEPVIAVRVDDPGQPRDGAARPGLGAGRPGDGAAQPEVGAGQPGDGAGQPGDGRLGVLAADWLPRAAGPAPLLVTARRHPGAAEVLAGAEAMLVCPLTLSERPSDSATAGLIAIFGEQRALADLAATMEILAHQVTIAVERLALRREVIRQGNQAYFRALVQDATDAIVIVGDDGRVRYATPSIANIVGDVEVVGRYPWDTIAEESRRSLINTIAELREYARVGPRVVSQRVTRLDGSSVHVEARCSDLRDDPSVAGMVFTLRDVTEQRNLEEELKHRAFHDALTGLPNRVLFQDRITQQLAAARRTGRVVGVLFVDVDDFKGVNDTRGHGVGDELLVAVGDRLADLFRDADTAARLGGDEFAVLIGDVADATVAEQAAERVVSAFTEPFALASGLATSTVSVGVATTEDSVDTDELLRHADLALYAAKAAGKRQWRRYQPVLSTGLHRRRELQEALEEAVARSDLTLVYQPIFELASGELTGFEALVRWPHAEWGMIQPDQFIGLAEETGLIIPLGTWVLGRAAADIMRWRRPPARPALPGQPGPGREPQPAPWQPAGPARRGLYVSVNVSARQFAEPGFGDVVRQALRSSGLDPGSLMLELTETTLLQQDERLHSGLAELKGIGVKLAIDDFGTGYSSLSYLRELPIDVVKIDRSFVDGIADSEQRLALARGIVSITRTLHLTVVAEGIETEIQRTLLTDMGCHCGQGYLLAMPMAASHAEELARGTTPADHLARAPGT